MNTLARCILLALLSVSLPAHGGSYRGPQNAPPRPKAAPPTGPKVPVPNVPITPARPVTTTPGGPNAPGGPITPGGVPVITPGGESDALHWETWWEFNKDPFLRLGAVRAVAPVTGSDDFYLGLRKPEPLVDLLLPTSADRVDRLVPALAALLAGERNRDVATACLVALGKIGTDGKGVALDTALSAHLARDDQEVRETAALALGIAGRPGSLPTLTALARDTADGRRLSDREAVTPRTRAFAAYGIGLLARRATDPEVHASSHDVLWGLLQDADLDDRDVRIAAVSALGLFGTAGKRLRWQIVEELLEFHARDLGRTDEVVQAHAPIAVARLLGRGTTALHQRCKAAFVADLGERKVGAARRQSAAVALGMLVVGGEPAAEEAPFVQALQECYERGHDRQARAFALIALGRIGGTAQRDWLLRAYERANKGTERPWLALALGLCAAQRRPEVDVTLAERLVEDLRECPSRDLQGALAIAVGLTGHLAASPAVQRLLAEREADEHLAGHLCVALALLGDAGAAPAIGTVLERSARRPFLLLQCAVALGHLGDRAATPLLIERLRDSDSTAVLAAVATALGQIGDRRSIEPLLELLRDKGLTKLSHAFVAAALGGIGDQLDTRWNLPLVVDCNYVATVDTLTNGDTGVLDIL